MTLRDKFKTKVSINTDGEAGRYAIECEQIADYYAIEFAEWYHSANNNEYHLYPNLNIIEHLKIFKKEKEL